MNRLTGSRRRKGDRDVDRLIREKGLEPGSLEQLTALERQADEEVSRLQKEAAEAIYREAQWVITEDLLQEEALGNRDVQIAERMRDNLNRELEGDEELKAEGIRSLEDFYAEGRRLKEREDAWREMAGVLAAGPERAVLKAGDQKAEGPAAEGTAAEGSAAADPGVEAVDRLLRARASLGETGAVESLAAYYAVVEREKELKERQKREQEAAGQKPLPENAGALEALSGLEESLGPEGAAEARSMGNAYFRSVKLPETFTDLNKWKETRPEAYQAAVEQINEMLAGEKAQGRARGRLAAVGNLEEEPGIGSLEEMDQLRERLHEKKIAADSADASLFSGYKKHVSDAEGARLQKSYRDAKEEIKKWLQQVNKRRITEDQAKAAWTEKVREYNTVQMEKAGQKALETGEEIRGLETEQKKAFIEHVLTADRDYAAWHTINRELGQQRIRFEESMTEGNVFEQWKTFRTGEKDRAEAMLDHRIEAADIHTGSAARRKEEAAERQQEQELAQNVRKGEADKAQKAVEEQRRRMELAFAETVEKAAVEGYEPVTLNRETVMEADHYRFLTSLTGVEMRPDMDLQTAMEAFGRIYINGINAISYFSMKDQAEGYSNLEDDWRKALIEGQGDREKLMAAIADKAGAIREALQAQFDPEKPLKGDAKMLAGQMIAVENDSMMLSAVHLRSGQPGSPENETIRSFNRSSTTVCSQFNEFRQATARLELQAEREKKAPAQQKAVRQAADLQTMNRRTADRQTADRQTADMQTRREKMSEALRRSRDAFSSRRR